MNKEVTPRQEFWLRRYPAKYKIDETLPIYRVALGDLIDATQRLTYPPGDGSKSPDFWNKTGSIGFMDVVVEKKKVPKEGTLPRWPEQNEFSWEDCEEKVVLVIQTVAIEPQFRGSGFARLLKQRAELLAQEWGLDTIVADYIENPVMRNFNVRLGYVLYDGGIRAVKRIKQ